MIFLEVNYLKLAEANPYTLTTNLSGVEGVTTTVAQNMSLSLPRVRPMIRIYASSS